MKRFIKLSIIALIAMLIIPMSVKAADKNYLEVKLFNYEKYEDLSDNEAYGLEELIDKFLFAIKITTEGDIETTRFRVQETGKVFYESVYDHNTDEFTDKFTLEDFYDYDTVVYDFTEEDIEY